MERELPWEGELDVREDREEVRCRLTLFFSQDFWNEDPSRLEFDDRDIPEILLKPSLCEARAQKQPLVFFFASVVLALPLLLRPLSAFTNSL